MFELICHHTYRWGVAADLTAYDTHGEREGAEFLEDGVASGSGAFRFVQPQHRVRIPASPVWQTLIGIKVEITARILTRAGHWQMLIAGDGAFSFFLRDQILFATFTTSADKSTWPLAGSDGITSANNLFTPSSFPTYYVPTGKWLTFGFLHNGLDTMELFVDGQLIARRAGLLAGVPGVGPLGVNVGNSPGNAQTLEGDIDEVKVWRLDPRSMERGFLSRPYDQATAECWEQFLESLRVALAKHPDCARLLGSVASSVIDRLRRAIIAKGPETRKRYADVCEEYARLWRAGQLDSAEMAKLLADWCAWLRLVGIWPVDDPELQELLQSPCLKILLAECAGLECDPQVAALVQLIISACCQQSAA